MLENEQINEYFDRYIRNELTDNERVEFENRLISDETFGLDFKLYSDIVMGIKIASEDKLREKLTEWDEQNKSNIKGKTVLRVMYLAAAAIIVLVIGVAIVFKFQQKQTHDDIIAANEKIIDKDSSLYKDKQSEKITEEQKQQNANEEKLLALNLYDQNYKQYPNKVFPKSRGEIPSDSFARAMYYYDQQEYKLSQELLLQLNLSDPENIDISYYLAMTEMAIGHFNNALKILLELEKLKPVKYYHAWMWYIGLLYLQLEKIDLAKTQFEKLIESKNPYSIASENILKLFNK